jgi:creatinine amidohydrolase
VDIAASTFIVYILNSLTAAYRDGARNFLILFATYSNGPFIQESMKQFVDAAPGARVMAVGWWNLVTEETRNAISADTGVPRSEDHHSGVVETSLIMHMAPSAVRTDLIDDEKSVRRASYVILPIPADLSTRTGIVFRARAASAEIGRRVTDEVISNLLTAVRLEFAP